jgi:acetyl esterase/lipase
MTPRRVWLAGVSSTNALFAYFINHDPPFPQNTQPINFVTPDFPPTCIFVACNDEIVPVNNSYDLAEKTRAAGVETLVVEAKDMPHGHAECLPWVRWPEGYDWWQEAIEPSLEFVAEKIDRV